MPGTVRYGLIGKEDLNLGSSTFQVTMPDGQVLALSQLGLQHFTAYGNVNFNLYQALNFLAEILTSNPTDTQGRLWYISSVLRYGTGSGIKELVDLAVAQTLTNKTLASPKITTGIYDANGNALLTFTSIASAVNQVDVQNSATTNDVILQALGSDTNISINIKPKGSGVVKAAGAQITAFPSGAATGDTLVYDGANWTRTSAGSIGLVLPSVSGTPAQHALYRDNVAKAWARIDWPGAGTITVSDSFNVASIVDNAVGDITVNWSRNFKDANYAVVCLSGTNTPITPNISSTTAKGAGVVRLGFNNASNVATDPTSELDVIAIGKQ